MNQNAEITGKVPYVTPSLRPIELITDEVLSTNCKVVSVCENVLQVPTTSFGS